MQRMNDYQIHQIPMKYEKEKQSVPLPIQNQPASNNGMYTEDTSLLRRIQAWDMHILCQKHGVVKLVVSGQYFEICLSDLIL